MKKRSELEKPKPTEVPSEEPSVVQQQHSDDGLLDPDGLRSEFARRGLKCPHRNQLLNLEKQSLFPRRFHLSKLPGARCYWKKWEVLAFFREREEDRPVKRWYPKELRQQERAS